MGKIGLDEGGHGCYLNAQSAEGAKQKSRTAIDLAKAWLQCAIQKMANAKGIGQTLSTPIACADQHLT
jgi:hypothetical protein